jgi:predicted metal-dependent phosphoesterase TrpH
MLIDLHTHTYPLSDDSSLSPDDLIDAARAARLDAVCLTEHDFFWDHDKVRDLSRRHDFLVLPGVEVNTEDGHVIAFGLNGFVYGMHRVADLARLAADAGGALIAAHPYRRQLPFELRHDGDWSDAMDRAAANPAYAHVCAIEALNGRGTVRENDFAKELCHRLGLPAVATSDAHSFDDVGRCATQFERPISDLAGLIAELNAGRFRPIALADQSRSS